jgi:hypothetical protein
MLLIEGQDMNAADHVKIPSTVVVHAYCVSLI